MTLISLTGLLLVVATAGAAPAPSDYEITSLPGLNATLGFKQYSGMMPINDGHGTELFFWFVESQDAPSTDPVVLWMNGGPGSSSLAYGFWTEHGPFRLVEKADGSAAPELYSQSWNQHANVLYLEAPTGVGFSFSTDAAKYKNITDEDSSTDNFHFLLSWFECFDAFKANDFFITAENAALMTLLDISSSEPGTTCVTDRAPSAKMRASKGATTVVLPAPIII